MKFTLAYGLAASLAVHAALALPFVLYNLAEPPEERSTLVIELLGVVSDRQDEERLQQDAPQEQAQQAQPDQTKEKPAEASPSQLAPSQDPPVDEAEVALPPPVPAQPAPPPAASASTASGFAEAQIAQTIRKDDETDRDRLRDYQIKLLKRVQSKLIAGPRGHAMVSFVILGSGEIRPHTLKIAKSSGQPALDANALKTIRASVPFAPPPREVSVTIEVDFGR
jgi:protein TonB